jgi:hypothetical protein
MIICCFECDLEVESSTYKTRLCNQNVTNSEKPQLLCFGWALRSLTCAKQTPAVIC